MPHSMKIHSAAYCPAEEMTLHEEFNALLTLLILNTSVNTGCGPVLNHNEKEPALTGPLDPAQSSHRRFLNALSIIIVKNHEIVASTAPFPIEDDLPASKTLSEHNSAQAEDNLVCQDQPDANHPKITVTTITNPREGNDEMYFQGDNTEELPLRVAKEGVSVWQQIKASDWDYINAKTQAITKMKLEDHISTLLEFLNYSRSYSPLDEAWRTDLCKFTGYLSTLTWPKMYRRIVTSSLSQHVFSELEVFSVFDEPLNEEEFLADFGGKLTPHKAVDRNLVDLLQLDGFKLSLFDGFNLKSTRKMDQVSLDQLIAELKKQRSKEEAIYSIGIARPFHLLLINVLYLYRYTLMQLKSVGGNSQDQNIYFRLWLGAYIIFTIANSSIIIDHLRFMVKNDAFFLINRKNKFSIYAGQLRGIDNQSGNDDGEDGGDMESFEESDDHGFTHSTLALGDTDTGLAILCWLKNITSTFSSLEYACRFLRKDKRPLEIRYMVTRNKPLTKRVPWEVVLDRAILRAPIPKEENFDAETVKDAIYWALGCGLRVVSRVLGSFSIGEIQTGALTAADRKDAEKLSCVSIKGSFHCETLLACASHFRDEFPKIEIGDIGVSKLCCPTCWNVLDVVCGGLDKKSDEHKAGMPFGVRGGHRTLSFSQLPTWLPNDYANEMLRRFSVLLQKELPKFIELYQSSKPNPTNSQTPGHRRKPSDALSDVLSQAPSLSDSNASGGYPSTFLEIRLKRFLT